MASLVSHLLVDGANVIHAWPDLQALLRRDKDSARARLIQILTVLHDAGDRRVTIVFDGRGPELLMDRPSGHATFSVLTTPAGTTADDVIERLVAQGAEPAACVVATEDRALRETVCAAGGTAIHPAELAQWVAQAEATTARRLAQWQTKNRTP